MKPPKVPKTPTPPPPPVVQVKTEPKIPFVEKKPVIVKPTNRETPSIKVEATKHTKPTPVSQV